MKAHEPKVFVALLGLAACILLTFLLRIAWANDNEYVSIAPPNVWIASCNTENGSIGLTASGHCNDGPDCPDVSWNGASEVPGSKECTDGSVTSRAEYDPSGKSPGTEDTVSASYCGKSDEITVEIGASATGTLSGGGACPGQDVNITARVRNTMGCTESFTWSVQKRAPDPNANPPYDPGEASVTFTPSSGSTGPIEGGAWSDPIPITATVGAGSPPGSHADIELVVEVSGVEATDPDNRPDDTIGVPAADCSATIGGGVGGFGAGTVDVPIWITNEGPCRTSFSWEVVKISGDLPVSDASGGTPALDQYETYDGMATIPVGAPSIGCEDTATIELQVAVGEADPSCTSSLANITAYICPGETITPMAGTETCGVAYGAAFEYCYACGGVPDISGWWAKERVQDAPGQPNPCQPGPIDQTSEPVPLASSCIYDIIMNMNGPPANVAPCTTTADQTIFLGPTEELVEECQFQHTVVIDVTITPGSNPIAGMVTTSVNGVPASCNWP